LKERARPGGKLGQVLDAIAGETGVSLVELVALTGWQPHTARAALSGLRKRGFPVQLMERDGRKAYRFEVAI
jgi:DNA-binding IclR family transcriptional regulator